MLKRSMEHARVQRQRVVSSAKLRGMPSTDIATLLADKGILNPRTNNPWSVATINKDIIELEAVWRDEMFSNISDHRARVLAELKETKAAAWRSGKLSLVLKAIDQEVSLLGLNELERIGIEIALTNLFRGFPKDVADQLKTILAKKVSNKKELKKAELITLNRALG